MTFDYVHSDGKTYLVTFMYRHDPAGEKLVVRFPSNGMAIVERSKLTVPHDLAAVE